MSHDRAGDKALRARPHRGRIELNLGPRALRTLYGLCRCTWRILTFRLRSGGCLCRQPGWVVTQGCSTLDADEL
jgi:hypothetical protein